MLIIKFNKLIKKYAQFFALIILKKDWIDLQNKLKMEYKYYKLEHRFKPSIIMQKLLISGEDHRFFYHPGFDVIAMCRAIYRRFFNGVIEGASTIDQQIVRILTGKYERTFKRKMKEIMLATLVTNIIPRAELPGFYIKIGYFGWRMNNFKEACTRLSINPSKITKIEAANIIARLKYPHPHFLTNVRYLQIDKRVRHLIRLYSNHRSTFIYIGLDWKSFYATI